MKIFGIIQIVVGILLIVTSVSDVQLLPGVILVTMGINLLLIDKKIGKFEKKK